MKHSIALSFVLALYAATPAVSLAQSSMKDMDMGKKPAAGTHKATGVVKKIDPKAGTVTLAHDPVKSLNWPAMTMGFQVKDRTLLDKVQPGKKVEFEFVQQGKDYVITAVK